MSEKLKNVAIITNENGDIVEILEIKTLLEYRYKELQRQSKTYKANVEIAQANEKAEKEKEMGDIKAKLSKHDLFVAKALFNDFVDKGLMETNDIFENMFYNYAKGVNAYDNSCEPLDFTKLCEGVAR